MDRPSLSPAAHVHYDAYKAISRFGNLDGLRFICISMVIWHHSRPIDDGTLNLFERGFLGVDFFFVISGYLITTLILREEERDGSFSLMNFYIRRAIRILPPYYFLITIVAIYFIIIKGYVEYIEYLPYYYIFMSNFLTEHMPFLTITWSLSVEEQYYMLWPLFILFVPVRYLWIVCCILIAVNVLGIMGLLGSYPMALGPLLFQLPNSTYAPIIMGSLAAILLHNPTGFQALYRLVGRYQTALVLFVCLVAVIQFAPSDVRGLPNLVIHSLMTAMLISLVVREDTVLTTFLAHPIIARIGAVSYGMYLYHLIVQDIVIRIGDRLFGGLSEWSVFIIYFILSYLAAELSFRTLEHWFLRFRPRTSAGSSATRNH